MVEVEAILNDRSLTPDFDDPVPLTPAHPLHGHRIVSLPYEEVEEQDLDDPIFGNSTDVNRRAQLHAFLHKQFHRLMMETRIPDLTQGISKGSPTVAKSRTLYLKSHLKSLKSLKFQNLKSRKVEIVISKFLHISASNHVKIGRTISNKKILPDMAWPGRQKLCPRIKIFGGDNFFLDKSTLNRQFIASIAVEIKRSLYMSQW